MQPETKKKKEKRTSKCTISVLEYRVQKVGLGIDGYPCAIILFCGGVNFHLKSAALQLLCCVAVTAGWFQDNICDVYVSALS